MTDRFDSELYYCHHCKSIIRDLSKLFFVEDNSTRGFCSETCVEAFFLPVAQHYQNQLSQLRKDLGIENESCLDLADDVHIVSKTCSSPSEVWIYQNKLGEKIHSFISVLDGKENSPVYHILLCYTFENSPSYIILTSSTSSKFLLERFRIGTQVENVEEFLNKGGETQELGVTEEMLSDLERKKSSYLAELMVNQLPSDIQCENFYLYESYFDQTLEGPDEVYSFKDDESDQVYCHIKAFEKDGKSFYYLILFLSYSTDEIDTRAMLPIISFPTLDGNLCESYRKGELVLGSLKS